MKVGNFSCDYHNYVVDTCRVSEYFYADSNNFLKYVNVCEDIRCLIKPYYEYIYKIWAEKYRLRNT